MSTKTRQPQTDRPKWVDYIEDVLGHGMYGDKWRRWLDWMAQSPPEGIGERVSNAEILEALQFVKRQKGDDVGHVSLDRLKQWIKWNRRAKIEARKTNKTKVIEAAIVRSVKAQMLNASNHTERWNIMCNNCTAAQCKAIDRWAVRQWSDFTHPEFEPLNLDGVIYRFSGDLKDEEQRRKKWRMETARKLRTQGKNKELA